MQSTSNTSNETGERHSARFWRHVPQSRATRMPWTAVIAVVIALALLAYFVIGLPMAH